MLTHFLDLLAAVISVTSLLIVTYGALIGIISFLKNEIRRFTGGYSITNIRKLRATFGTYLLLGLEFLIASDILKTVLEPTLNELALLGGIVVLRTILSVFLNKEMRLGRGFGAGGLGGLELVGVYQPDSQQNRI